MTENYMVQTLISEKRKKEKILKIENRKNENFKKEKNFEKKSCV